MKFHHLETEFPRSASQYSVKLPKHVHTSNSPTMNLSRFVFVSPHKNYLQDDKQFVRKTTYIKQSQSTHNQQVKSELSKILSQTTHGFRKRLIVSRRQSISSPNFYWEHVQQQLEQHGFKDHQYQDLFQDLIKPSPNIVIERYNFKITQEQFYKLKHIFIMTFIQEQNIHQVIYLLEQLRLHLYPKKNIYYYLKGIDGINRIIHSLIKAMSNDITMTDLVMKVNPNTLMEIAQDLIQPIPKFDKLIVKVQMFVTQNQVNYVHYTNFKMILYHTLKERSVDHKGIIKLFKRIDTFKYIALRVPSILMAIQPQYPQIIESLVQDKSNMDIKKKSIELLLEYFLNNQRRVIKHKDIRNLTLDLHKLKTPLIKVISRYTNKALCDAFKQDYDACMNYRYKLPGSLVDHFAKEISQYALYINIYKDNDVKARDQIESEFDFIFSNRTHFRYDELRLIHKRLNITNDAFDLYIQTFRDVCRTSQIETLVQKINHYRDYIVNQ